MAIFPPEDNTTDNETKGLVNLQVGKVPFKLGSLSVKRSTEHSHDTLCRTGDLILSQRRIFNMEESRSKSSGTQSDVLDKALRSAAEEGNLAAVRQSLEAGADVNSSNFGGITALMHAAWDGRLQMVEFLVKEGSAKVDHQDKDGTTALIYAAEFGRLPVVEFLVKEGSAKVDQQGRDGKTAEQLARDRGHTRIAKFLKEAYDLQPRSRNIAQLCLSTENTESRTLGFQEAKHQLIAALQAFEDALADERESSERLRQSLSATEVELQSLKQERDAAISDRESVSQELQNVTQERDAARRERESVSQELQNVTQERDAARHDHEDVSQELQNVTQERDAARRDHEDVSRELQNVTQERDAARRDHEDIYQEIQALQQRMRQCEDESRDWVVDRNEIMVTDRTLGEGGWGSVKVGRFRGTEVAVKQIHHLIVSPHNRQLFEREMTIAARCRHPCLLQFIGATCDDGTPLFATEILETDLRQLLSRENLQLRQIVTLSLDIARAMAYLHGSKPAPIIHRNISSSNILMWRERNTWRGKLSDYGAANFIRLSMTCNPGAWLYSAPEAGRPEQTPKLDVFSFGVLLCETCIRELPMPEHRQEQISRISWQQFRDLINQCVQLDPQSRPDSLALVKIFSDWWREKRQGSRKGRRKSGKEKGNKETI